jgi:hypothetical protein
MRGLFACLLMGIQVAAVGCGGGSGDTTKYAPVAGIVTLDGKPIEGATVSFVPKKTGQMSFGLTGPDGKFSLKSAAGQTGAAVGDHGVTVVLVLDLSPPAPKASADDLAPPTPAELGNTDQPNATSGMKFIIPERYGKPGVLSATVPDSGLSDHKLELQSK